MKTMIVQIRCVLFFDTIPRLLLWAATEWKSLAGVFDSNTAIKIHNKAMFKVDRAALLILLFILLPAAPAINSVYTFSDLQVVSPPVTFLQTAAWL